MFTSRPVPGTPANESAFAYAGILTSLIQQEDAKELDVPLQPNMLRRYLTKKREAGAVHPPLAEAFIAKKAKLATTTLAATDSIADRWARPVVDADTLLTLQDDVPSNLQAARVLVCVPDTRTANRVQGLLPVGSYFTDGTADTAHELGLLGAADLADSDEAIASSDEEITDARSFLDTAARADDESYGNDDSSEESSEPSLSGFVVSEDEDDLASAEAPPKLEEVNPVPVFDGHIFLYEDGEHELADGTVIQCDHTYVVNGEIGYTSSTTLLGQYFDKFDPDRIAAGMVNSPNWRRSEYYPAATAWAHAHLTDDDWKLPSDNAIVGQALSLCADGSISFETAETMIGEVNAALLPLLHKRVKELCQVQIKADWAEASPLGTEMHERLEDFFNGVLPLARVKALARERPEIRQFLKWYNEWYLPRNLEPYRMELRVADYERKITGSIDGLFRNRDTGEIIMVDWKRSRKLRHAGFRGKRCTGILSHLQDCNVVKYSLQQNLYARMLRDGAGIQVKEMYLAVFHPKQGEDWHVEPIPDMDDTISAVFAEVDKKRAAETECKASA